MRILLLTNVFPNPYQPTKGTFNLELARAIARRHELDVISPVSWLDARAGRRGRRGPLPSGRRELRDGFEVAYPPFYYTPKVLRTAYAWFMWHSVRRTVDRIVAARRPDAVLGYWAHPDGAVAVRVAKSIGVPSVVMLGGSDVLLLARGRLRRAAIVRALTDADAVVTMSADLRQKVSGLGIPPEKIHVGYRGVDTQTFCPGEQAAARRQLGIDPSTRALLWVGRMVPVKGLNVLLDACAELRRGGSDFTLYLVGDGPLRGALESQAVRVGVAQCVKFVGAVAHHDLPVWFRAADATVLSSLSEGVPNVLRESLACGTPFVASRVGGVHEIADAPGNILVEPGDAGQLADALRRMLASAGQGLRVSAPQKSWDESAAALTDAVRGLIDGRRVKVGPSADEGRSVRAAGNGSY